MQLTCRLPREIEAVPITLAGVDYLAVRREDIGALFHEGVAPEPEACRLPPTARAAPKKAAAKATRKGDMAERILGALKRGPATALEISDVLAMPLGPVKCALFRLMKRKAVIREGSYNGKYLLISPKPIPAPAAKQADPRDKDLTDVFLAELKTGPKADAELVEAARRRGMTISGRFAVSTLLENHPDVIGGNGGRWTLAKGAPHA